MGANTSMANADPHLPNKEMRTTMFVDQPFRQREEEKVITKHLVEATINGYEAVGATPFRFDPRPHTSKMRRYVNSFEKRDAVVEVDRIMHRSAYALIRCIYENRKIDDVQERQAVTSACMRHLREQPLKPVLGRQTAYEVLAEQEAELEANIAANREELVRTRGEEAAAAAERAARSGHVPVPSYVKPVPEWVWFKPWSRKKLVDRSLTRPEESKKE